MVPSEKDPKVLEYSGLIFHDLRRYGLTRLSRAGVSAADAMGISGHRTACVFQRYNIADRDSVREVMGKRQEYDGHERARVEEKQLESNGHGIGSGGVSH